MSDITPTNPEKPPTWTTWRTGRGISSEALFTIRRNASIAGRNGAVSPSGTVDSTPRPDSLINRLNERKRTLEQDIARVKRNIALAEAAKSGPLTPAEKATNQRNIDAYQANLRSLTSSLAIVTAQLAPPNFSRNNAGAKQLKPKPKPKEKKPPRPLTDTKLRYNVGSVTEAYFTSRTEFLLVSANTDQLSSAVKDNQPTPALTSALELWNNGKSSKGMIVTWRDILTRFNNKDANNQSKGFEGSNETLPPHAFRFQYNPGSISMAYAGTPLVDPNFEAAGLDKFNLTGTGVTQSTIQFQLLINRMYDMKYYTREDEQSLDGEGGVNPPGTLRPEAIAAEVYGKGVVIDFETQRAIYNMGTMYDLEYLLRTMMGYTMRSALRDYSFFKDGGTADMGFLGARPVELHLGKNMRYLGYITGINVEHVIFDNRMVPLFSNVSLSFSRLPDYYDSSNPSTPVEEPAPVSSATSWGNSSNIVKTIFGR